MPNVSVPPTSPDPLRARQKSSLTVLAVVLIVAGLGVALFLTRIPLPLRLVIGAGDVLAGCVLLLLVRQKFDR